MTKTPTEPPHATEREAFVDLFYTLDLKQRHTSVGGRLLDQRQLPPSFFLGRTYAEILGAESASPHEEANRHALAGETFTYEWTINAEDGPEYYQTTVSPLRDVQGLVTGIVGVGRCVTGLVQTERIANTYRMQAMETLQKYQLLAELTTDVVIFARERCGAILEVNRAAEEAYGYSRERLLTLRVKDLAAPGESLAAPAIPGLRFETTHQRADGSPLPVEVSTIAAEINGDQVVLHVIRDITLRRRRDQAQWLLRSLDERILANDPLEQILYFAAGELVRIFDLPLAWIGVNHPDGHMSIIASAGPARDYLDGARFRWDQDGDGDAARTGLPQTVDLADPNHQNWSQRARDVGLRYALAVPLKGNDQVVGTLNLYRSDMNPFEPTTVAEVQNLAGQIGVSLLTAQHQHLIRLQSAALAAAANAVMITDRQGVIQWINPAFTQLTGFARDEVYGRKPSLLRSGRHTETFYRQMWEQILSGQVWQGQVYNCRRDGTPYVEEMTITPVRDDFNEVTHFVAIKQDITERRRQEERIFYLATHDFLTGLQNRSGLNDRLEIAVKWGRRGRQSALILIDLDNFKLVNDTVGHPAGDQLLVSVARLMVETTRQVDSVARLGGDEFSILLEDVTLDEAREVSERIRATVDGYRFHWGDHVFTLTASLGIAVIDGAFSADEVLALADAALYEAKSHGKNRVAVRSGIDEKDENLAAARWMARIKDAIAEDRFEIHYQPVNCLATGQPLHVEALVRMRDPDGQLIGPNRFIPIAERYGFMPDIDRYVIKHAIATLAANPGLHLFINLSGLTLSDSQLGTYIRRVIEDAQVNPQHICFEITETTALLDMTHAQERMREIKMLGCRFALDDFGSGFASFAYLRSLPVDYIKLDGSFTQDLESNTTNRALAKAVVDIAHVLGKEVIAEHVETSSDARVLQELGVEYGQGFLWGRPAPR